MSEVKCGERFAKSPLTGAWYRVTAWEERGDGHIVSHQKEEVTRNDVPAEWIEAIEELMDK